MRLTCSCFQSVSIDWSFVFTYIILAKYNRNKHVWDVCIESYYHYLFVCLETKISRKSIGNLMVTMSFDWDVEWKELIFCVAFQKDLFPFFNGIKLNTSNISMFQCISSVNQIDNTQKQSEIPDERIAIFCHLTNFFSIPFC